MWESRASVTWEEKASGLGLPSQVSVGRCAKRASNLQGWGVVAAGQEPRVEGRYLFPPSEAGVAG